MISLELTIEYANEITARTIYEATEPDNSGHVLSEISGNVIKFSIVSENAGTLRNAADDLMACIKIAEETSGIMSAAADLDGDALFE